MEDIKKHFEAGWNARSNNDLSLEKAFQEFIINNNQRYWVTSFRMLLADAPTNLYANINPDGISYNFDGSNLSIDYFFKEKDHFEIFSVLNKLNNIEYKIGDINKKGIIESFQYIENSILVKCKEFTNNNHKHYLLNDLMENTNETINNESVILFTTEDNIPIKYGDKYHRVDISKLHDIKCDFNCEAFSSPETYQFWNEKNWGNYRVFGNEDNAKFFLLVHSPLLTVNEILELIGIPDYSHITSQKIVNFAINKAQVLSSLQS